MGRAIVIAAFLSAAFIAFLVLWPDAREKTTTAIQTRSQPKYETPAKARNVTPQQTLPGPVFEDGLLERIPDKKPPPLPKKKPTPIKVSRVQVVEAGILESGERRIYLSDIEPLPLDEKCKTQDGLLWPCGRFARTEMRQFVRNRTVECDPISEGIDEITIRCRLDNFDMSAWLVLTGWAKPNGNYFNQELQEAKLKERGQWRKSAP